MAPCTVQFVTSKLHLDRLSKVCWIAITGLAAAFISDATSKGFLVLTFLMFIRCSMKAKEVRTCRCARNMQRDCQYSLLVAMALLRLSRS